jgi:hypothetical protein
MEDILKKYEKFSKAALYIALSDLNINEFIELWNVLSKKLEKGSNEEYLPYIHENNPEILDIFFNKPSAFLNAIHPYNYSLNHKYFVYYKNNCYSFITKSGLFEILAKINISEKFIIDILYKFANEVK